MAFRDILIETILNIGESQIDKGKFNVLPDSFLVRELIRLELIYARQKDDRFRDLRLTKKGKQLFIRETLRKPAPEIEDILSRFGKTGAEPETALIELICLDCE